MKIKKLFLIVAAASLVACQPKKNSNDNSNFQCIAATLTIAGKQVPSVIQWNTKTGATRILDSTTFVSRAGAQNVAVGWIPLSDLQNAIQEMIARDQMQQQQQQQAQQQQQSTGSAAAPAAPSKAAPTKTKK